MLITDHWSASGPNRINDYHVEFGLKLALDPAYNLRLGSYANPSGVDWTGCDVPLFSESENSSSWF